MHKLVGVNVCAMDLHLLLDTTSEGLGTDLDVVNGLWDDAEGAVVLSLREINQLRIV